MEELRPRTEFVRKTLEEHLYGPDMGYAKDLLALERLASDRPLGFASSLALSNLISKYPQESDAILGELGVRPFVSFEEDRLRSLMSERLRLALERHPLARRRPEESPDLFEF
jgi:hypothetical protein